MLDSWRLAIGTLTAVPTRPPRKVDRPTAGGAMLLAPLAAAPLAVLAAGISMAGPRLSLPNLVTALLVVGAVAAGNRAFHLDWSLGHGGRSRRLLRTRPFIVGDEVRHRRAGRRRRCRDRPRTPDRRRCLPGRLVAWRGARRARGLRVSLCALPLLRSRCPPARPDGHGVTYAGTVARPVAALVWVVAGGTPSVAAYWAGLDWWKGALAALLACAVVVAITRQVIRRFGGVTGDVFGAPSRRRWQRCWCHWHEW